MPDIHITVPVPTEEERALMESRVHAFIFPNDPQTEEETEAFNKAVEHQIAHEKTAMSVVGSASIPQGTKAFSIGNFNMTFDDGTFDGLLTKKNICPAAYGVLLRAGLLYKGAGR